MKQVKCIYVTAEHLEHKQLQKGAKFTHKIHKIVILITHFTCHETMTHYTKLFFV